MDAPCKKETAEGYSESLTLFKKALMLGRMVGAQVMVRRAVRGGGGAR